MKQLFLVSLFYFLFAESYAQVDSIASIKLMLANEQSDSIKLELFKKLSWHYMISQNDSANYYNQQMLDLAKKTKNPNAELLALSRMARAKWDSGYTSDALELALNGLELAIELKDTLYEFFNLRQIMWIYGSVQNYPKYLENAQKLRVIAATQAIRNSNSAEIALTSALNGIGLAYKGLGQNDSALFYLKQSFDIFAPQPEVWPPRSVVSYYLGNFYEDNNMPDSALYYYRLSLANAPEQQSRQAGTFFKFGKMFFKKQMIDSAYIYAKKSLPIAQSIRDSTIMEQSNFLLADIFHHLDKPDSAYTYLRDAVDIQRVLNKRADINKTGNMLLNENLHMQQLEQQRIQAEKQYKNNLKLYSLFGVVSVFLLLSIIQYRNNKQRQKAALEIKASYEKLKSTQSQLIQSEKMASLGELTAGIAHEIQNPLNFVNNFSEVSRELISEMNEELAIGTEASVQLARGIAGDIDQNLEKINHHGKRADAIVKGMLQHSRTSAGQKEPTDINALADEYLRLSYHGLRAKEKTFNADFKTDFDPNLPEVEVIPQDIGRVLLNLINNAFYACAERSRSAVHERTLSGLTDSETYKPTVTVSTKNLGDKIEIRVKDNGPGIPEEIKNKIFQPFFTTKPTGQGTGLGLSLSYEIITKGHGGNLALETTIGKGSEFIVSLKV